MLFITNDPAMGAKAAQALCRKSLSSISLNVLGERRVLGELRERRVLEELKERELEELKELAPIQLSPSCRPIGFNSLAKR
jgi:hypothetical protein